MRWLAHLRRALFKSLADDIVMMSKAAAYSAILMLFPAILVGAALAANLPGAQFLRAELRELLYQMFPPDVPPVVMAYFQGTHGRSFHLLISASIVSVAAASSVMVTLMECSRRAYNLPVGLWSFWHQRAIAFLLVPLSLFPLMLASLFVVFGHQIELWMVHLSGHDLRVYVLMLWRVARWLLALLTSVAVIATIYHTGMPRTQSWRRVMPGAVLATVAWFPSTLIFGWYVTRHANYAQYYGSLGAGIAMLIWLYIVMISVMIGAEFNAELYPKPFEACRPQAAAAQQRVAAEISPTMPQPATQYNDR